MPFSDDLDPTIVEAVSEEYQKAAFWLPFTALEIKDVFDRAELEQLSRLLREVKEAAEDNDRKAKAIEKYSKIAFKLLKMAKVMV